MLERYPELLGNHTHDVFLAHDQQFVAVHFYAGARILAEQDAVADFDGERTHFAVVHHFARADRQDFALIRLLCGVVGNDDPAGGLAFFLNALHDDSIVQGTDFHGYFLQTDGWLAITNLMSAIKNRTLAVSTQGQRVLIMGPSPGKFK